jgi:hypothetical protein
MANMAKLYELQKIDTTWEKVRRRLVQLRGLLVESEELRIKRLLLATAETERQHWHALQTNAELEAQSLAERITATESRLMSGQVRNPKELEALQASLEALRRQREGVENEGVEALLKFEEGKGAIDAAQAELTTLERKWKNDQAQLLAEENKLRKAFLQLKKQREEVSSVVGEEWVKRYDDLRQRKAGVAIAGVERNMCGACHVAVPTGILSAARSQSTNPVLCPSCGRILFIG